jgi:ankyrin repeat protein
MICTPLNLAVRNGRTNVVKVLLDHPKIDLNLAIALSIAAEMGYAEVASHILEKGANVNQAEDNGASPLFFSS